MWVLICNYIIVYRCMIYYFTSVCKYIHICVCVCTCFQDLLFMDYAYDLRLHNRVESWRRLSPFWAPLRRDSVCLCVCVFALVPALNNQWRSSALVRLLSSCCCCCCCYCITCIFIFFAAHSTHTHTQTHTKAVPCCCSCVLFLDFCHKV